MLVGATTPEQRETLLKKIDFVQRLDQTVPMSLAFQDETGQRVRLASLIPSGKPVILNLVYYECPMLCTESLNGLLRAMRPLSLSTPGDYTVLTISFDPRETAKLAQAKKKIYLERYNRNNAEKGWRFLTGDEASIRALTDAVGFQFTYDADLQQYAHASGLVILTPEGRISRYLYGVDVAPKDLKLALLDASAGKIGTTVDKFLLFCYHYDPLSGRYSLLITRIIQMGGLLTVIALAGTIGFWLHRERTA